MLFFYFWNHFFRTKCCIENWILRRKKVVSDRCLMFVLNIYFQGHASICLYDIDISLSIQKRFYIDNQDEFVYMSYRYHIDNVYINMSISIYTRVYEIWKTCIYTSYRHCIWNLKKHVYIHIDCLWRHIDKINIDKI